MRGGMKLIWGVGELVIWDEREKTINPLNPALNEMREEIQKA
jgi:hypothetical protein